MNEYNMPKAQKSYNDARDLFKSPSEKNCVLAIELLDRDVCLEHLCKAVRDANYHFFSCAWVLRANIWHYLLTSNKDKHWNIYLESRAWKQKCDEVLIRDNRKCRVCGALAEKVYHKRDDKLGKEPLSDLVSRCKDCKDTS